MIVGQTVNEQIFNSQADTVLLIFTKLEDKYKHYNKLKNKWNKLKTTLRYSKYSISILFAGADAGLAFIPIVKIPLAIIRTTVILDTIIIANDFEDSFVNVTINNYNKNVNI